MSVVRRVVHALILVLMLLVGATSAVVIVSQTSWFKNWLRAVIVRQAGQYLNGTLSIGRLGGNLLTGLEMENVGVSIDGSEVVAVRDLGLDYNVLELVSTGLSLDKIRLDTPVIYLRREGSAWSISRLIKKQRQEADRQGPMRPIAIAEIDITDGAVIIDDPRGAVATSSAPGTPGIELPKRFDRLDAKLAFHYSPVRYTIDIAQMSFRGSDPEIALDALSGGVSVRNDTVYVEKLALRTAETSLSIDGAVEQYLTTPVFNVQISSDKFSLPEMARLVPALSGIRLQPAFELKLDGPLDRLGVDVNVRSSAGQVTATIVADVNAPRQSVAGAVSVRHLDLAPLLDDPKQKSDVTADAKVDLHAVSFADVNSVRGTVSLDAPRVVAAGYTAGDVKGNARIDGRQIAIDGRAAAYGATATAVGKIVLPARKDESVAFDLHGQARHVDLRRLPRDLKVPAAATDVGGEYHVAGSTANGSGIGSGSNVGSGFRGLSQSEGSRTVEGDLRFAPSTVGGARIERGSALAFRMDGTEIAYEADATIAELDLQRVGEEFRVPALADDRYKTAINGRIVARGRGTTAREMDVTASGTLHDSLVQGGQVPRMAFDVAIRQDRAHVKATGSFAGFDPAVVSGKPAMKGTVAGTLDVDGTVTSLSDGFTPDTIEGTAKINLEPSNVGGLDITSAAIDGDYRRSTADLRTFDIVGRDLDMRATGTLALDETGQSNLTVHADSPSIDQIGKLVDLPVAGIGQIDLTLTGNKRELQAVGKLVGGDVKYGTSQALSLSSDFTAKVPELDVQHASVSATTHGTFVTVAGQNIDDLTAMTGYVNRQVTFDATAKQPQRTVATAGSLVMHPDHNEVHLQRLSLAAAGMTWQTAAGSEATIEYTSSAVKVSDFRLVNGDQQITADGGYIVAGAPAPETPFERARDSLKVVADNVDIAVIDALMLRPPRLSGRLNATATVASDRASGSSPMPEVKADFTITKGGFQKFQYDSFGGTVDYGSKMVYLDTRLQQNPAMWIDVKGQVPAALLSSDGSTSNEPIDLKVDSTPIDVGLVQGFTTALTQVTGTLEAHVHVTGSAADPHPDGAITVQNAAFTFVPNGVAYTQLDGKIDLQPDRVHIDQIRVLDNQRNSLTLTGDLAIHEFQIGGLTMALESDDFKVIDNAYGSLRVNGDLHLTGQLSAPRLDGNLGVTTGAINLDPILNLVGTSAYSTEETQYLTPANAPPVTTAAGARPSAPSLPAILAAMQVDVRLTVPDDLVIKANDLRALDSPISLGSLNVTLGGNLYVGRTPYDLTRIWGAVNTIRGTYNFQGRQFTILRDGTIRFEGLDQFDPSLNIRTERVIQAVTANVTVGGTLQQPEVVLSSTPPLEQADILSLIVFNQPINQLGEGQQIGLAQRAQALATGAVATELANSIGNALGLDVFEISTAPDSGAAAELTIGQQLGQNLYVKVQQGIGDQSQTNVILEYELAAWLRLQTNVIQGSSTQQQLFQRMQGSGVDLLFFFSY